VALRRLTGLDAAFLAAESPSNPLHVMGVLVLDPSTIPGGYTFERFQDFIGSRVHLVPPLRRRLLEVPFGLDRPRWLEESHLDLDYHIRRAAVPAPGGPREVATLAAEIDERRLDRSRPLWEIVIVEGLEHGRIALVAKLSHAMMDGFAGMHFMASLFRGDSEIPEPPVAPSPASDRVPGEAELLLRAIPAVLLRPARAARAALHSAAPGLQLLRQRSEPGEEPPQPPRMLLSERTTSRRSAAYTSLSLSDVKAVGRAHGATVNDVLLATVSGALRRYLDARGELPEQPLVAGVPVSTHGEGDQLANSFSSLFTSLATDLEDPVARLHTIHASCQRGKHKQRAIGGEIVQEWSNVPPPWFFSAAATLYTRLDLVDRLPLLCNLVVSNVAGPPDDLYLGGARLEGLYPLGPIYAGVALNATALSYRGALGIGLVGCRDHLPDIEALSEGITRSLAELISLLPVQARANV
jgi:WS/DGAT/MGAT family acyltransferase